MPRLPIGECAGLYGTIGLQYWDADGETPLPDQVGHQGCKTIYPLQSARPFRQAFIPELIDCPLERL